jgi:hypothetical protein
MSVMACCLFRISNKYKVCILWPNDTLADLVDRLCINAMDYLIYIKYGTCLETSTRHCMWLNILVIQPPTTSLQIIFAD